MTARFSHLIFINCEGSSSEVKDRALDVENYSAGTNIVYEYYECFSKGKLKGLLSEILQRQKEKSLYPIIHIEAHGSKQGLKLKSTARINWVELFSQLSKININSCNNLVVFLASCKGAFATLQLLEYLTKNDIYQRAPALMIFGPNRDITYSSLATNVDNFYRNLLYNPGEMDAAIQSLDDQDIYVYTCVQMYKNLIDSFVSMDICEKYQSKIKFDMYIMSMLQMHFRKTGMLPTLANYKRLANIVTNEATLIEHFHAIRKNYFMIDICPKNEYRFPKVQSLEGWTKAVRRVYDQRVKILTK